MQPLYRVSQKTKTIEINVLLEFECLSTLLTVILIDGLLVWRLDESTI
jgi:hypothetical protein